VVALISCALSQISTCRRHTPGCRVAFPIATRGPAAAEQRSGSARFARIIITTPRWLGFDRLGELQVLGGIALGLVTAGREIGEEAYEEAREHLLALGLIRKGRGRDAREKRPASGEKGRPRLGLQCGALAQRRQLAPHDQAPSHELHRPPDQEPGAIQVVLTLVESLMEEMVETPA
jgi:hypothetical protein